MYKIDEVIYGKWLNDYFYAVTQKPPKENLVLYYIRRNLIHPLKIYGALDYQRLKLKLVHTLDKNGEFDYLGRKR